jgi:hypothetical protein
LHCTLQININHLTAVTGTDRFVVSFNTHSCHNVSRDPPVKFPGSHAAFFAIIPVRRTICQIINLFLDLDEITYHDKHTVIYTGRCPLIWLLMK